MNDRMDYRPMADFPSAANREALRHRLQAGGWNLTRLDDQERYEWHAYDFGWRRVVGGGFLRRQDGVRDVSGIDPYGDWYDEKLAAVAEKFYRNPRNARV